MEKLAVDGSTPLLHGKGFSMYGSGVFSVVDLCGTFGSYLLMALLSQSNKMQGHPLRIRK